MTTVRHSLKRALLIGCLAAAGGCAGPHQSVDRTGRTPDGGAPPLIYLASPQSPRTLERCLLARVPEAHAMHAQAATLFVGPNNDDADWILTLQDNGAGTNLSVFPPRNGDGGTPEEPELRFDIARCAV